MNPGILDITEPPPTWREIITMVLRDLGILRHR